MKDVPIEELAAVSPEIHDAAARVGCSYVSLSRQIWPGGRLSGAPEEAARFVEFSWLRAAVVNGRAVFEEADSKAFAALLTAYGLGDETASAEDGDGVPLEAPSAEDSAPPVKIRLEVEILPATKRALDRLAHSAGVGVGEFLDLSFREHAEGSRSHGIASNPE